MDKLANKYKQLTPYQNAGNSPISDYDIDGNQGKNTPKDGDKKQKSEKKSNDSSTEGGKDKNSVVNGNDSNEILNHHSVEHGKIELLPPEPDNPIESTPEDTLNTAKSELQEKELPKLPMEETEMPKIAEVIDPEMVEYEPQEQSKEEKKSFFNTVYSIASAYVQKTEKLLIKGGKQLARAAKFIGNAAKGIGYGGILISVIQSGYDLYERGINRETVTKGLIGLSIAALSISFPVVGVFAIAYAYADDKGYVDKWIYESWKLFDKAVEGIEQIKYEVSKGIYNLEKGLSNGWRP